MIYLDIHPNISIHKGEYYIIGTEEALKEATEFKDNSLYKNGANYLGKSKIVAKTFTIPIKEEKEGYKVVCPSKELLDNFYKIDFKVFYCPDYIDNRLFIDRGTEFKSNSSLAIYIPYIKE